MTLVFLDTETTGLDPDAEVWEIGLIVCGHREVKYDGEYEFQVRPDLRRADPNGLRIGRFYERFVLDSLAADRGVPPMEAAVIRAPWLMSPHNPFAGVEAMSKQNVARELCLVLDGATWVGMVPSFDELRLGRFVDAQGYKLTHHYHLVDAEPLIAGFIAGLRVGHAVASESLTAVTTSVVVENARHFNPRPPWDSARLTAVVGAGKDPAVEHTALGDAQWAKRGYEAVYGTGAGGVVPGVRGTEDKPPRLT